MLTTESIAASLWPRHASTFGGNPVAAAAAVEVLRIMLAEGFAGVQARSRHFLGRLEELAARQPRRWRLHGRARARGRGLLLGLCSPNAGVELGLTMVQRMFEAGALINFAGNAVLRFVPPPIVTEAEIDQLVDRLDRVLADLA